MERAITAACNRFGVGLGSGLCVGNRPSATGIAITDRIGLHGNLLWHPHDQQGLGGRPDDRRSSELVSVLLMYRVEDAGRCRRHRIVSTQLDQISCNKGRRTTKRKPLYERSLDSSSGITRTYFWIPRSVQERVFESWRRCSESRHSKPVIRRYRQPFLRLMNGAAARYFSAMSTSRFPCDEAARTAAAPFKAAVNFAQAPRSELGRLLPPGTRSGASLSADNTT